MVNSDEKNKWIRPWNLEKFDNIYNRDERYFSILMKGLLSWLNRNVIMYNKPILHFVNNTGNSYMYMENIGYEFSWSETSGEDQIYMQTPRCIVSMENISFPTEELTSPYARGTYERLAGNEIRGFNAQIRRLPIQMSVNLKYVLSTFNEAIVLLQEILDVFVFQRYFNIVYLGQTIECSIEYAMDYSIQINPIDMTATDTNQKVIEFSINVCSSYPKIGVDTEIPTTQIIHRFTNNGIIESTQEQIINTNANNNSSTVNPDNNNDDNDDNNSGDNSDNNSSDNQQNNNSNNQSTINQENPYRPDPSNISNIQYDKDLNEIELFHLHDINNVTDVINKNRE